jgi:hypothetical protein
MRSDGTPVFYLVQHWDERNTQSWVESALDHFLFADLTYDEKRGDVGDCYRRLLEPQNASTDLWQRYGIHGFERRGDAMAALRAVADRHPDRRFRLVMRVVSQRTRVIA